jgi:hypothetical protein
MVVTGISVSMDQRRIKPSVALHRVSRERIVNKHKRYLITMAPFIVSTPDGKVCKNQRWTSPQLGLLLKCKIRKYTNLQCAQVLEHYFHGRTEGKDERVVRHAQSLNQEPELKDENGQLHDGSFAIWVQLHQVTPAEVEKINSNWANWTTIKTHEGVLLELLLSTKSFPHSEESHYAGLLQQLIPIPNQHILPTSEPPSTLVARICEAFSRFKEYKPPLRDDARLWKKEAIKDWIKAWKVEEEVAQIFEDMTTNK